MINTFEGQLLFDSGQPLQEQVKLLIKRNIISNHLVVGDKIPTENELCEYYKVSRVTVRAAIKSLEEEGLLMRIRGKGTFVAENKLKRKMETIYSFSHQIEEEGMVPTSTLISFNRIKASDAFSDMFGLDPDSEIFEFTRIRRVNGTPSLLETSYIPEYIHPKLTAETIAKGSLYDSLRDEALIIPERAEETYECVILDNDVCDLLECKHGKPGFFIERTAYLGNNKVYEFTQSYMRSDNAKLSVTLTDNAYKVIPKNG